MQIPLFNLNEQYQTKIEEPDKIDKFFHKAAANLSCILCGNVSVCGGLFISFSCVPVANNFAYGRVYGYSLCSTHADEANLKDRAFLAEQEIVRGNPNYQYLTRMIFDDEAELPSIETIHSMEDVLRFDRIMVCKARYGYFVRERFQCEKFPEWMDNFKYVLVIPLTLTHRFRVPVPSLTVHPGMFAMNDGRSLMEFLQEIYLSLEEPEEDELERYGEIAQQRIAAEPPRWIALNQQDNYEKNCEGIEAQLVTGDKILFEKDRPLVDADFIQGYRRKWKDGTFEDVDGMLFKQIMRNEKCFGFDRLIDKIKPASDYISITDQILADAFADQHYLIPEQSVIELAEPVAKVYLFNNDNYSQYVLKFISIENGSFDVYVNKKQPLYWSDYAFPTHARNWFFLLSASIIRDFLVTNMVSHRRKVSKNYERVGTGEERKLVEKKNIVYLPRTSYKFKQEPISKESYEKRVRVEIAPHFVRGHIRTLPDGWNATRKAQLYAEEFSIHLQERQTFVRPYKKGETEQLRVYKSKSALKLLFLQEAITS